MYAKQNPFSLYDFLGYFTPGALLIYGCLIINESLFCNDSLILNSDVYIFADKVEIYLLFILLSYVLGHIISFISSITIEKYAVWMYGYPTMRLLGNDFPNYILTKNELCKKCEEHKECKECEGYNKHKIEDNIIIRNALRRFVFIILTPISILDITIGTIFKFRELYIEKLDCFMASILKNKIK